MQAAEAEVHSFQGRVGDSHRPACLKVVATLTGHENGRYLLDQSGPHPHQPVHIWSVAGAGTGKVVGMGYCKAG